MTNFFPYINERLVVLGQQPRKVRATRTPTGKLKVEASNETNGWQ